MKPEMPLHIATAYLIERDGNDDQHQSPEALVSRLKDRMLTEYDDVTADRDLASDASDEVFENQANVFKQERMRIRRLALLIVVDSSLTAEGLDRNRCKFKSRVLLNFVECYRSWSEFRCVVLFNGVIGSGLAHAHHLLRILRFPEIQVMSAGFGHEESVSFIAKHFQSHFKLVEADQPEQPEYYTLSSMDSDDESDLIAFPVASSSADCREAN